MRAVSNQNVVKLATGLWISVAIVLLFHIVTYYLTDWSHDTAWLASLSLIVVLPTVAFLLTILLKNERYFRRRFGTAIVVLALSCLFYGSVARVLMNEALIGAVHADDVQQARLLLVLGADPGFKDNGLSARSYAEGERHPEILQLFNHRDRLLLR